MERLFTDHNIAQQLPACKTEPACDEQRSLLHETFCCKRRGTRYLDAATADEVALIYEYTRVNQQQFRVIRRLRIGNIVYHHEQEPLQH